MMMIMNYESLILFDHEKHPWGIEPGTSENLIATTRLYDSISNNFDFSADNTIFCEHMFDNATNSVTYITIALHKLMLQDVLPMQSISELFLQIDDFSTTTEGWVIRMERASIGVSAKVSR